GPSARTIASSPRRATWGARCACSRRDSDRAQNLSPTCAPTANDVYVFDEPSTCVTPGMTSAFTSPPTNSPPSDTSPTTPGSTYRLLVDALPPTPLTVNVALPTPTCGRIVRMSSRSLML